MVRNEQHNVLIVMSDEQRWDSLGYAGNPAAHTPHLDALAEQSTVFDGCYTPFPLCCPSRASLWTGRMPRHHHMLGNWRAISPDMREAGLGRAFARDGYHTVYCGKWHVPGTSPARMGFDDRVAIPAVLDGRDRGRYIEPYRAYVTARGYELVEGHVENLTAADVSTLRTAPHRGTARIPLEHYLETWQTREFLRALENAPDDRPWFAVCSFNAPHFPMIVPEPYDTIIDRGRIELPGSFATGPDTKPGEVAASAFARKSADLDQTGWVELIAHYLGLCALVDAQVASIVEQLRRTGKLDRTIIVYTSDHGDMLGAHRLMEKGHLLHYEEALRIPLLIRHPEIRNPSSHTESGLRRRHRSNPDGAGRSRLGRARCRDLLRRHARRIHGAADQALCHSGDRALWHGRQRQRQVHQSRCLERADRRHQPVGPTESLRYIYRSRDVDELYDHTADPQERRNVAADPAYESERLALRRLLAKGIEDVFPQVAIGLEDPE